MVKINSKLRVPTAVTERNRFNLDCKNITTMDFYKLKPVYTRELVPKSSIKMNMGVFTRLSPLVKPVYGDCKIVSRGFFVPFRTILDGWNEFIEDTTYKSSSVSIPTVSMSDLVDFFTGNRSTTVASVAQFKANYTNQNFLALRIDSLVSDTFAPDFISWEDGVEEGFYRFTQLGKHVYDILCSLGYGISFKDRDSASDYRYSLLPLLSYYKLFQDWYRNSAYNYAWPITFPIALTETISSDKIFEMLKSFRFAFYERDYFTAAWDNPIGPNNFTFSSQYYIADPTVPSSTPVNAVGVQSNGTPNILNTSYIGSNRLTKFALDGVRLLTDYMKRHQLAGTQAMERYLAQWGILLPDSKLNRSVYLGKSVCPVQIADLMNMTAPSSDSSPALGEYAGRGQGSSQGSFEFSTEEFGQFFVVSVTLPDVMYVQGIDRALQHFTRASFFQPEFDKLGGSQAIRVDELVGKNLGIKTSDTQSMEGLQLDHTFGFTSRYAEYKTAVDRVTGDFLMRLDDESADGARFHMARILDVNTIPAHSLNFTRAEPNQYNRIFADSNNDFDHFINVFYFNVTMQQPMSRLFDDYEFEDADAGQSTTVELNGVTKD